MKTHLTIGAIAILSAMTPAIANDDGLFDGAHIGAEAGWQRNKIKINDTSNQEFDSSNSGYDVRGFAGYDRQIGERFVLGAEAGVSLGGPTTDLAVNGASLSVDPGLTFDVSSRAGVVMGEKALVYGRVGYGNTKLDVTAANSATTNFIATAGGRKRWADMGRRHRVCGE